MNNELLSKMKEQLLEEEQRVAEQIEEARQKLSLHKADAKRIKALLANIEKGYAGGERKQSKPSPKASDVVTVLEEVLTKVPAANEEKLFPLVEQEIVRRGFTRMGFKLRFKEAVADERFEQTQSGIALASREPARASA